MFMELEIARRIFSLTDATQLTELRDTMIRAAIAYAEIRAEWAIAPLERRPEMDQRRRIAHNTFIDACNILSRNMAKKGEDITWRRLLGDDRKTIGDFACYLHCMIALSVG